MLFIVGFVIIAVVIYVGLLDVLVRISNYRNGTQYQTGPILKDSLTYLWNKAREETRQKLNYQKNSQASAQKTSQSPVPSRSDIYKKEDYDKLYKGKTDAFTFQTPILEFYLKPAEEDQKLWVITPHLCQQYLQLI